MRQRPGVDTIRDDGAAEREVVGCYGLADFVSNAFDRKTRSTHRSLDSNRSVSRPRSIPGREACRGHVRFSEQPSALFRRQPVPEADADPSDPSHAPDARSQFGTQQTGISRFVRDPGNRGDSQVDGCRRVTALLQVDPITENHRAVEREPRLRAVPGDELANRMLVAAPAAASPDDGLTCLRPCRNSLD